MKYRTDLILGEAFRGLDSENRENDKMQKLTNCTMLKYCLRGFIQLVLLTIGSISAIDSKSGNSILSPLHFDSCVLSIQYINHHAGNFRATDNF